MTGVMSRPRADGERGSISVWFATAAFAMVVLVGLVVDVGGKVHTQQQARNVAVQAARTGAQEVQAPPAMRGEHLAADGVAAKIAAEQYLSAAGVSGTVSIQGGTTVVVRTTDVYNAKFLSIIGLGSMRVTGEGSARMVRTLGGVEQ